MSRHRLIVGVDYGTTYSGVSYVTTDKESLDDIYVITNWPGKDGEWKTPTRIAYTSENAKYSLKDNLWGYQVEPGMVSYSWTKLLLDKQQKDTEFDDPAIRTAIDEGRLRLPPHRNAQGVAADYLCELYSQMERSLVKQLGQNVFNSTPMDCWLTVPAVWSDQAQSATKAAAREAGFASRPGDTLSIIPEPEAAAVAVLKRITRSDAINKPQPGETILICDCGGGTVDITSYTIAQITPSPIFEEVCVGIGGKCGSTSIDRSLDQLMRQRFGSSWENVSIQRRGPGSNFMNKWEEVKKQFGRPGDERDRELGPVNLKGVPDSKYYDEEEAMIRLTKDDVKALFDPTVNEVIKLVQQQKTMIEKAGKKLNRLILVGGFGDSAYLYRKLEIWCAEKGGIRAFCPEHPQAAIVRGAALRGLVGIAPRVKRCRRSYGCPISMPFREGIDPPDSVFYDPFDGMKRCNTRMLWLIKKGEAVTEATCRSHSVNSTRKVKDLDRTLTLPLYSCAVDVAPEYQNMTMLETVGTVHVNWNGCSFNGLVEKREKGWRGTRYHVVPFEIQVLFGSKSGSLTVKALYNGVLTGNAEILFE